MVHARLDAVKLRHLHPTPALQGEVMHEIDHWARFQRFLILGSESGTYYAGERDLTLANLTSLHTCLEEDPQRAITMVEDSSHTGRAPKHDPAIFALAAATTHEYALVRKLAFSALPRVCRTGIHLLHFVAFREALGGGWGRGMRRAIGAWFANMSLVKPVIQAGTYSGCDDWALEDLLRLAHFKRDGQHSPITKYIIAEIFQQPTYAQDWPALLVAVSTIRLGSEYPGTVAEFIRTSRRWREVIPPQYLKDRDIWDALLADMPITAMIRNLGTMTSIGLVTRGSDAERHVVNELQSLQRLKASRVHPLSLLVALKVYEQGHCKKDRLTWHASKRVINALDESFYLAFGAVEPMGKRLCVALDVSGSMTRHNIAGMPLTPREASAAMALVTVATEPNTRVVAFSAGLAELAIHSSMRLSDVLRVVGNTPMGGSSLELPIRWARETYTVFDGFVTYTDIQGGLHTAVWDELARYRRGVRKLARHAVVAMEANQCSIADPDDPGQLDVAGFDITTPAVLSDFFTGRI
jgi:60 kDa SS-A/Ro ribonucleoprotein